MGSLGLLFYLANVLTLVAASPTLRETSCGYEKCKDLSKEDYIKVHLIPHSHDDVGWLKTVDQYYYGTKRSIQSAGVNSIISSVVKSLKDNPDRRFIQVETAFFWKWWSEQTEEIKDVFRRLVNNGQIEMVNGAWSMNDEADTHYQSTIDQYTWGLRKIDEAVGKCGRPKVGWQIDPFGHSREHASILNQMGFHGLFLGRLDYRDKEKRINETNMEFMWTSSANRDRSELFTSIFAGFYTTPDRYCFDVECGDAIVDDKESPDYNVEQMVDDFADLVTKYSKYFKTKNVLIPMGGDFHFQAAETNYLNIDKLIKYFNEKNTTGAKLMYSTPSCYIYAVNQEATENKVTFANKKDDFFPYASDAHSFWTGYFTSRPNSKRIERMANNYLQAAKQLATIGKLRNKNIDDDLVKLREAVGIMQHHDAITGTEKQAVSQDYARIVFSAIEKAEKAVDSLMSYLFRIDKSDNGNSVSPSLSCPLSNVSVCAGSNQDKFRLTVYNPLSHCTSQIIRVPVNVDPKKETFTITKHNAQLTFDIIPTVTAVKEKFAHIEPASHELVFSTGHIPAMGANAYFIEKTAKTFDEKPLQDTSCNSTFGTEALNFKLNTTTNLLESVTMNGGVYRIEQRFMYYPSAFGNNSNPEFRSSGAYIFRPSAHAKQFSATPTLGNCVHGTVTDEVELIFNDYITQVIRVDKTGSKNYIEFDWIVGPINVDDRIGKEIISTFTIEDIKNDNIFYTDSNGREMLKRTLNKRNDYEYDPKEEPTSSNYYPVTSKIVIKDVHHQMAVLTDRAQGGASMYEGEIELMIHRRILNDDAFGVEEALNESEFILNAKKETVERGVVARGTHYLIVGPSGTTGTEGRLSTTAQERIAAQKILLQPIVFAGGNETFEELNKTINFGKIISQGDSLQAFAITEIEETTLSANEPLSEFSAEEKMKWSIENKTLAYSESLMDVSRMEITLEPMQIRTFIIKFNGHVTSISNVVKPLLGLVLILCLFVFHL